MSKFHTIRLILGDQLNREHSWYKSKDDGVLYVIAELHQEATYVTHHIQKLCSFFAAMADFAQSLGADCHTVQHCTLDETVQYENLTHMIRSLCERHGVENFHYQAPDEFRLTEEMRNLDLGPELCITCYDSE
ncbi:MAG: cryptochrome/photolyase family protein, partial [Halioglobus sp.]